jgi:Rad3-related DNA helicase
MSFPLKHRPIITSTIGGKMTSSNEKRNWKRNIGTVKRIIKKHKDDRGVIHTQSYSRAKHVARSLFGYSVFLHDKTKIDGDVIDAWNASRKKILLSPAVSEGVDLKDDLCRYQILLKVPYPSVGDARVKYLLDKKKDWKWYYSEASRDIVQMYGRAVRSGKDHAKFYVIDGSFRDILRKGSFPAWFLDALQSNSISNYM